MSDIENLIMAVEGFPCLWDPKHEKYYIRDAKDSAWEQICKEFHSDDGEELNGTLLVNACNSLKKKWTHIRDYYRKDLNRFENMPTGSRRFKRYKYAPFLEFLKPTFEKHSESDCETESKPLVKNEDLDPLSPCFNEDSAGSSEPTKEKRAKLPNTSERKQQADKEDDDEKFLLSFRSDMKRMNNSQKIDFKIGTLQLLKKIIRPED